MTPEAIRGLQSFLVLTDFQDPDDPQELFSALLLVIQWQKLEAKKPTADNDSLLTGTDAFSQVRIGVILHLATLDRKFFGLAKRMAARTIVRHNPPAPLYCEIAAALLVAGDGPKSRKPALTRNVVIILAIATLTADGFRPTESHAFKGSSRSGCGKVADSLGMAYGAVEGVWTERQAILLEANFDQTEVSNFLRWISLTTV